MKVATDVDAPSISTVAIPTTIAFLRSLPAPRPLPQERRVAPVETSSYELTATLTEYRLEADGEVTLVLSDEAGRTMLARLPSIACSTASRFAAQIGIVRQLFDAQFVATSVFRQAMVPVEIRGVALFDFLRGEHGAAPNGIELHPVTSINYRPFVAPPPPRTRRRATAGPGGTACRPPSLTLTASTSSTCAGGQITLTWQASDSAARVTLDGFGAAFPASGSTAVAAGVSSAYSGHAANSCGAGAEAVAVVAVRSGPSASLSGPASMTRGSSASLSVFTDAASWTLSSSLRNPISPSSGTVAGAATSTYTATSGGNDTVTLTSSSACGSLTRTISIFVNEPVNTGLLCCDGTRSPTCFNCSSKQGCCSGHGGVCGCQ